MAEQIALTKGQQGYTPSLALFSLPAQDNGVSKVQWVDKPVTDIFPDGSLSFVIHGSGTQYIDLRRTLLRLKVQIKNADGTPLPPVPSNIMETPDAAKVGPVNLLLHSMWRQIDIYLQDQLISSAETAYPYKAMIDTLLETPGDLKESMLQAQMFYKDTDLGTGNASDPILGGNFGLVIRSQYFRESAEVDMQGPLLINECKLDRYLLNGIKVGIKLFPTTDAFRLISPNPDANYKLVVTSASLKVCTITPSPEMVVAHQRVLEGGKKAFYPYMRSEIKQHALTQGQYSISLDDIFLGRVPSKVVVCMVNSLAMHGSYSKNPFFFRHFKTNYANITINGESFPSQALQPVFTNSPLTGNYINSYLRMYGNGNDMIGLTRDDYATGYTLFCFDLNPDVAEGSDKFWPLLRTGNLGLELHFSEGLPEPATLMVYGVFPTCLQVDETRRVSFLQ